MSISTPGKLLTETLAPTRRSLYPLARGALGLQDRAQLEAALAPLGRLLLEAASSYYVQQAARIRQRMVDAAAALGGAPPEIAVATAFKVWCCEAHFEHVCTARTSCRGQLLVGTACSWGPSVHWIQHTLHTTHTIHN